MRYKAVTSINSNLSREAYMRKYFKENKAVKNNELEEQKKKYDWYRDAWKNFPKEAFKKKYLNSDLKKINYPPLCVDVEVAALCDLACSFCYRQHIATPDKIISLDLAYKLIDQASELGTPSMKFNWRGEPLLHPKLPEIIKYAKTKGILETIINTNATKLDEVFQKD